MSMYFIIIILLLIIKTIRGKSSKIRLTTVWIMPLILILGTAEDIIRTSNINMLDSFIFLIFIVLGAALGVIRSRFLRFENDEKTGEVIYYNSIISLAIMIAIMLFKMYIRNNVSVFMNGFNPIIISDALLCMTCSTIVTRKVYIVLKYVAMKNSYMKD